MKMRAKLAVLALALVVLAGAWFLAAYMAGQDDQPPQTDPEESVDISAGLERDITALSWSYQGQTVNLSYDGAQWTSADYDACPIDQQAVEPLVQAVCSLTATVVSRDVETLDAYGLAEPALIVMAATADHIATYQLGSPSSGGGYYLRVDDSSTVYGVEDTLLETFSLGLADVISLDILPDDVAQVTALRVRTDVEEYTLLYDPALGQADYAGRYAWFRRQSEADTPLDAEKAQALCQLVLDMDVLSCVSWDGEDEALYGFDAPQGTVTLDYTDAQGQSGQTVLEFGAYGADGVYVRRAGEPVIYLAAGAALDGLMYPDWTALTPLYACPMDWQAVTRAVVTWQGQTYDICRYQETTQQPTLDERQSQEITENIYSASGWLLDADGVEAWLQALTALQGEQTALTASGREQLFSVSLYDGGEEPVTMTVYTYDSARCLCVVDNGQELFVSRADAFALAAQLSEFLNQE
jgi:hypothetical protein